jgi:hypothetical protein
VMVFTHEHTLYPHFLLKMYHNPPLSTTYFLTILL